MTNITIASKSDTTAIITPAGLSTPTDLIEYVAQTGDFVVEGYLSLGNMAIGDTTIVTESFSLSGINNYQIYATTTYTGIQTEPVVRFHGKLFQKDMQYKVALNQTAGIVEDYQVVFILQVMSE
jgi:hypothetical protein